jgi:YgiT-type zinc finger domain-containing protein
MERCTLCKGKLRRSKVDHVVQIGKETVGVQVPALACSACGESFTAARDLELAEGKVAVAILGSGMVTGPRFRFLRHFLGLSAKQLGQRIETAHETISRWENGRLPIPRLAWIALGGLVRDRLAARSDTEDTINALDHPRPLRAQIAG